MARPYISFNNLLESRCLRAVVALYLGVVVLEISVDFWWWYPRLGLSAEERCCSLWRFASLAHWHLATSLTLAVGPGSLVLRGWGLWLPHGVCLFHWRGISYWPKRASWSALDLKVATAPQLGHINITCQSSAEMLNKQKFWSSWHTVQFLSLVIRNTKLKTVKNWIR